MTIATSSRLTQELVADGPVYEAKDATEIIAGTMVALEGSTPFRLVPVTSATGLKVVGVAAHGVSATATDRAVKVLEGLFGFDNDDTTAGTTDLTAGQVGSLAYGLDNATVTRVATGRSAVGVVNKIEGGQVFVNMGLNERRS